MFLLLLFFMLGADMTQREQADLVLPDGQRDQGGREGQVGRPDHDRQRPAPAGRAALPVPDQHQRRRLPRRGALDDRHPRPRGTRARRSRSSSRSRPTRRSRPTSIRSAGERLSARKVDHPRRPAGALRRRQQDHRDLRRGRHLQDRGRGRRARPRARSDTMAGVSVGESDENPVAINVTPLVDIIFCLCVFFMISFKFKQLEGKFDSWLPKGKGARGLGPGRGHPRRGARGDVLGRGQPAHGPPARATGASRATRSSDALIKEAHDDWVRMNKPDTPVTIDAEARVPWNDVINVMNLCKSNRIDKIEFALGAPPPAAASERRAAGAPSTPARTSPSMPPAPPSSRALAALILAAGRDPSPRPPQEPQGPAPSPSGAAARNVDRAVRGRPGRARGTAQDFAETPGYRRLLELVARYGEEELREPGAARARLRRRPRPARRLARRDRARARRSSPACRPCASPPRSAERVDAYRAIVTEADGSEGVVVDFLEPPPEIERPARRRRRRRASSSAPCATRTARTRWSRPPT